MGRERYGIAFRVTPNECRCGAVSQFFLRACQAGVACACRRSTSLNFWATTCPARDEGGDKHRPPIEWVRASSYWIGLSGRDAPWPVVEGGSEGDLDEPRLGDARFRLAFAWLSPGF